MAAKFDEVLSGVMSREAIDRWAAQWVASVDSGVEDAAVWWGLRRLCGIDSRHGAEQPYLHDDEQIAGWRDEFRTRCTSA